MDKINETETPEFGEQLFGGTDSDDPKGGLHFGMGGCSGGCGDGGCGNGGGSGGTGSGCGGGGHSI